VSFPPGDRPYLFLQGGSLRKGRYRRVGKAEKADPDFLSLPEYSSTGAHFILHAVIFYFFFLPCFCPAALCTLPRRQKGSNPTRLAPILWPVGSSPVESSYGSLCLAIGLEPPSISLDSVDDLNLGNSPCPLGYRYRVPSNWQPACLLACSDGIPSPTHGKNHTHRHTLTPCRRSPRRVLGLLLHIVIRLHIPQYDTSCNEGLSGQPVQPAPVRIRTASRIIANKLSPTSKSTSCLSGLPPMGFTLQTGAQETQKYPPIP
jgi:hypothetical protein